MDIQQFIELDKNVFLDINGSDSSFWDSFIWLATSTYIWIPTAIALLYIILKNNIPLKSLLIIFMIALLIVLADRISSGLIKPYFQRWRPSQDPSFMYLVDVVNGYRGGRFGFISSHASNTFALAMFLSLLIRRNYFTLVIFSWAIFCSYTRVYLGVHYPGDILGGMILGLFLGFIVYKIYNFIQFKFIRSSYPQSSQYTKSGFLVSDINWIYLSLVSVLFFAIIVGLLNTELCFL